MKKFLILVGIFLISNSCAYAWEVEVLDYSGLNMDNFWIKTGKYEQKILETGTKIINANKLEKRIAIKMDRRTKIINADTDPVTKTVTIYYGLLPYLDNDDELASIMGHEMGHALDDYGGVFKWMDMRLNSKAYETKADLIGIDLMVKAGYNPVAAICVMNKIGPEDYWSFWILASHPKSSKRMMDMYKYIYVKYPWALKTDMVHNVNYENFTYSSKKEIDEFLQHEKERAEKQSVDRL